VSFFFWNAPDFQTCICNEGYKGAGCSEPDCPGEPDCYNNGECSAEPYFENVPDQFDVGLTTRRLITKPRCINCQKGWIGKDCGTRCVNGTAVSDVSYCVTERSIHSWAKYRSPKDILSVKGLLRMLNRF